MEGRQWSGAEPNNGYPYMSLLPNPIIILNDHVPLMLPTVTFQVFKSTSTPVRETGERVPTSLHVSGN
jgi:hypothetical protein